MPVTSVGYSGSMSEIGWAVTAPLLGDDYGYGADPDCRVSVFPGLDRSVAIAPGVTAGYGVTDTFTGSNTVSIAALPAGVASRWFTIAVERDWNPTDGVPGRTRVVALAGGASQAVSSLVVHNPGVIDHQPLALVQITAGQQEPTAVEDVRHFPVPTVVCRSSARPGMLGLPGPRFQQEIIERDTGRRYQWTGAAWVPTYTPGQLVDVRGGRGSVVVAGGQARGETALFDHGLADSPAYAHAYVLSDGGASGVWLAGTYGYSATQLKVFVRRIDGSTNPSSQSVSFAWLAAR